MEYELTINATHSSVLDIIYKYNNHASFYYETSTFKGHNLKYVYRKFKSSRQAYIKRTEFKHNYCLNGIVYKCSKEIPLNVFNPNIQSIYACVRCTFTKDFKPILMHSKHVYYEFTIKYLHSSGSHINDLPENIADIVHNYMKTPLLADDIIATAAIEFPSDNMTSDAIIDLLKQVQLNFIKLRGDIIRYASRHNSNSQLIRTLQTKPKTINPNNYRNVGQMSKRLYSHKYDGQDAFILFQSHSQYGLIVGSSFVRLMINGAEQTPESTYFDKEGIISRVLSTFDTIIHAERMQGEIPLYIAFAILTSQYKTMSVAINALNNIPLEVSRINIIKKEYYTSYKTLMDIKSEYPSDGCILTAFDDHTLYTKAILLKIKKSNIDTVDLYYNAGRLFMCYSSGQLTEVFFPGHNLTYIIDGNMIDNNIYEFALEINSSNAYFVKFVIIRHRADKIYPNSMEAFFSTYINISGLVHWQDILLQDGIGDSHSINIVRSPVRKEISQLFHHKLRDFITKKCIQKRDGLRIVDIGGGKLGYSNQLVDAASSILAYYNIDLSQYDAMDGIIRLAGRKSEGALHLLRVYKIIIMDIQDEASIWSGINEIKDIDIFISIFAFHFTRAPLIRSMWPQALKEMGTGHFCIFIVSWNYDNIKRELPVNSKEYKDYLLAEFSNPSDTDNGLNVRTRYDLNTYRYEPGILEEEMKIDYPELEWNHTIEDILSHSGSVEFENIKRYFMIYNMQYIAKINPNLVRPYTD